MSTENRKNSDDIFIMSFHFNKYLAVKKGLVECRLALAVDFKRFFGRYIL